MEETRYYRFTLGSVIVRRTSGKIEKNGKKGIWEEAPELARRFVADDDGLIEISKEEASQILTDTGRDPV